MFGAQGKDAVYQFQLDVCPDGKLKQRKRVKSSGDSELDGKIERLERAIARLQSLGLKRRRFAILQTLDVGVEIARVQLANASNVSRRPDAKTVVGVIRPINLIMPALKSRPGEIGYLVVLESVCRESIHGSCIELVFGFFVKCVNVAFFALLPETGALFVRQSVSREMHRA